jgi:hypothetical protein
MAAGGANSATALLEPVVLATMEDRQDPDIIRPAIQSAYRVIGERRAFIRSSCSVANEPKSRSILASSRSSRLLRRAKSLTQNTFFTALWAASEGAV